MRRAIIVDDEISTIELIKLIIKKYNIQLDIVGEAQRGDEAVRIIKKQKPDIVFMDIEMPPYTGLQAIQYITEELPNKIDFIIITAYDNFIYAQKALRLGAKDILLKPIEASTLIKSIENVLGYEYTDNNLLNEILDYVTINYSNDLILADVAEIFCTTPNQISRLFNNYMNKSFTTYINQLRINKSIELLLDSNMPIKEIALEVGYNNLNYFYKLFKKTTGTTPSKFKKS